jgi:hypothetical protein
MKDMRVTMCKSRQPVSVIADFPVVSFDTSAHNRLVDDGPLSEPVIAGLKSGLFFRFVGLSIEEIVATSDPDRRAALFRYCARLQSGMTDCIYPHNELIKRQVQEHSKNPAAFDWKRVDVRAREYERAIRSPEHFVDASLSLDQKRALRRDQKQYEAVFVNLRPKLQEVFAKHGAAPPPTFNEAIARLQSEGTLIWSMGKELYDRPAEADASEATIRQFMDVCPPFRALIYALLMSWYDLAVREQTGEKFEAGRNDLFMAVHLAYCDKFVTAERYRVQEKCLREIALVAGLDTQVLSYDDFCDGFLVTV